MARAVVDVARLQPGETYAELSEAATWLLQRSGLLKESRKFLSLVDRLWQKQEGVTHVKITTPGGEPEVFKKQLVSILETSLNRRCLMEEVKDPKIIGGLMLAVGDERFDCTLRTAMNELGSQLAAPVTIKS